MECDILKELAVFDPKAPIDISISFDDSDESEEIPIKSEKLTDDYNNQIIDHLPDAGLTVKKEITEEPMSIQESIEEMKENTQNDQNILQKDTSLPSVYSQNNLLNNNFSRKRKITELNIYKNKRKSSQSCMSEPNNQSSPVNDCGNMCENSRAETSLIPTSNQSNSTHAADPLNPSKNCNVNQVQNDKLSSYIKRCLLPISEHMRIIMEAYSYHKEKKTPKEQFNILKRKMFNLSYSTAIAMLLPEENNLDFIKTFLKETHRHACETSSVYKGTLKDYETLLRELLYWTKYNKNIIDKATSMKDTVLKPSLDNENKNGQDLNKTLEQNSPSNIIEKGKNAEPDKICLFSAGFQGNDIRIDIDPTLQNYLHNINNTNTLETNQPPNPNNFQKQSQNPSKKRAETELIKCLTKPNSKCKSSKQKAFNQPIGQPMIPQSTNSSQSYYPSQRGFGINNTYINVPLQQSVQLPSQQILQQYGLSSEVLQQCKQPTNSAPQFVPTHQGPQYGATHQGPHQYWQSQIGQPQDQQLNRTQSSAIWQPPHLIPGYRHQQRPQSHNPPSYEQANRQRQFVQQKQQQHLLRQYLPSQNVSPPTSSQHGTTNHIQPQYSPVQQGLPQYRQVQSGQPQNGLPHFSQAQAVNLQPENPSPTEWQQSNILQYQTQSQTGVLTHSSSPRTVSTDSGFISPLNIISSEQTAPPNTPHAPSEGSETADLLITHVTSLNPKVAFIEEDKCVVCKTSTKQVCMGCMQRYYCSYDCQLIDWTNHKSSCKHATT